MKVKIISLVAFFIAIAGLSYLIINHHVLSENPLGIAIQICAFAFMIWARITFGFRSFHLTANSTMGELVTHGPYRWLRHPIYASTIYFSLAIIISYPFIDTIAAVALIVGGQLVRMLLEEKYLLSTYSNYSEYSKRVKRLIPFVF
jgi:Putative protein-S-isoprenylcysteine methyltransferase